MDGSAVNNQDFLIPVIALLVSYILVLKFGGAREKRKRDDRDLRRWWMNYQTISPYQLAELIERKSATYLEALEYLVSLGVESEDSAYMLDCAIQDLSNRRENEKKG